MVRDAYEEALDVQQRLFVMRGQMEKLKGEQVHLQDFIMQLQDMNDGIEVGCLGSVNIDTNKIVKLMNKINNRSFNNLCNKN